MPRKTRIHYPAAIYHVMIRGNNKQLIFFDDDDRQSFCCKLESAIYQYDCKIHLFCLMDNHVHLVVEVSHIPVSKIMQSIMTGYAKYINHKQKMRGHLFEGRFKSALVQDEKYLMELCCYIHMNPIHGGLTKSLDNYRWSSHGNYMGRSSFAWVHTGLVLQTLERSFPNNKMPYHDYVTSRQGGAQVLSDIMPSQHEISIIGDKINKQACSKRELSLHHLSFEEISAVVCKQMKLPPEAIVSISHRKEIVFARSMITYFSHYHGRYYLKDLADLLDRNAEVLSRTMHQNLRKIRSDKTFKRIFRQLQQKLGEV